MSEQKEEKKNAKQRNYIFVDFEVEKGVIPFDESKMRYLVYQKERCPKTGKIHYQGFVQFHKPQHLKTAQKLLNRPGVVHMEPMLKTSNPMQAAAYCKKDESRVEGPWEYGQVMVQGARSDLQVVAERLVNKEPLRKVALENPAIYIGNFRGMEKLAALVRPAEYRPKPQVIYIWGPPGTGKSSWVRANYDPSQVYFYRDNEHGWFDGYQGQDTVIVDEFLGKTPLGDMLQLIDYGAVNQPVKGGFVPIHAYKWVFTSNSPPEWFYASAAWERRVKEFMEVRYME